MIEALPDMCTPNVKKRANAPAVGVGVGVIDSASGGVGEATEPGRNSGVPSPALTLARPKSSSVPARSSSPPVLTRPTSAGRARPPTPAAFPSLTTGPAGAAQTLLRRLREEARLLAQRHSSTPALRCVPRRRCDSRPASHREVGTVFPACRPRSGRRRQHAPPGRRWRRVRPGCRQRASRSSRWPVREALRSATAVRLGAPPGSQSGWAWRWPPERCGQPT